jgi:hypothetical protein
VDEYFPLTQLVQLDSPLLAPYRPAMHGEHAVELFEPVTLAYFPAAHFMHDGV